MKMSKSTERLIGIVSQSLGQEILMESDHYYNKTLRVLALIRTLIQAPNYQINDEIFRSVMGHPAKATYHKLIEELTNDQGEISALLIRKKEEDTFHYFLNESYRELKGASSKTEFVLECYSRLGSLLPEDMQSRMAGIAGQKFQKTKNLKRKFCHVKPVEGKPFTEKQKENLPKIINAILSQNELRMNYIDSTGANSTFLFRPFTLCMYREDLYLVGHYLDNKEFKIKNCKIRRIEDVCLMESKFTYPAAKEWDPQDYFRNTSGIINNLDESCDVQIRVYGVSRLAFRDKTFFSSRLIDSHADYDQYELTCTRYNEFIGQLFVYAQDIEIMDHDVLSKLFVEKATQAVARNASKLNLKKSA